MQLFLFTIAVVLVASVAAAPTVPASHVVHERRADVPKNWVKRSRVSSKVKLPMRIGLVQSNLEQADDLLMEV